jgi:2-isopropylmalate synthase
MWDAFVAEYLREDAPVQLVSHESTTGEDGSRVTAQLMADGEHRTVVGEGNGPIAAFVAGLQTDLGVELDVVDYSEHAVGAGSDAVAVAYVETQRPDGAVRWGVGRHESITTASFRAVISAVNRHRLDSHTVERHEP